MLILFDKQDTIILCLRKVAAGVNKINQIANDSKTGV